MVRKVRFTMNNNNLNEMMTSMMGQMMQTMMTTMMQNMIQSMTGQSTGVQTPNIFDFSGVGLESSVATPSAPSGSQAQFVPSRQTKAVAQADKLSGKAYSDVKNGTKNRPIFSLSDEVTVDIDGNKFWRICRSGRGCQVGGT